MAKIKEKPAGKDPKALDKVSRMPKTAIRRGLDESAKRVHQSVRDVQGQEDTPENYGAEKIDGAASEMAARTGHGVENVTRGIKNRIKTRESYENVREDSDASRTDEFSAQQGKTTAGQTNVEMLDTPASPNPSNSQNSSTSQHTTTHARQDSTRSTGPDYGQTSSQNAVYRQEQSYARTPVVRRDDKTSLPRQDANAQAYQGGKQLAQRAAQLRRQTQRISREELQRVAVQKNTPTATAKAPVKAASKGSVKTAHHNVKAAGTTTRATGKNIKTAERTAKATAKTARQTAQTAAKTARAATKVAAQAVREPVKAMVTAIKAIIAAVKGLVAAIAAGGWVAIVIILAVGIVAAILCSAFGIFYSNESADGKPMTDAIVNIDAGFKASVDTKIAELSSGGYDAVKVAVRGDIDGDSVQINNWSDVLSVYAVMLTTDKAAGTDVIIVTPEKLEKLNSTFSALGPLIVKNFIPFSQNGKY